METRPRAHRREVHQRLHGAVTSDRKNASYGPNVTLAVMPEDDCRFDNLAVTGAGGGSWAETKPCPNGFCHGGQVDCFYCGGDGVQ